MVDNRLSRDWDTPSLLRFAAPTIAMMLFMGLYTAVDTIFAARFVGTYALSAINIVCPVVNVTVGLGTMLAAGGSAVISRELGEGNTRAACEDFTLLVIAAGAVGLALLAAGRLWMAPLLAALKAEGPLLPYCRDYLGILLLFLPASLMQTLFANLFVTAGRPGLGFGLSALAGGVNLLLDYLLMVPMGLGIRGAALGTGIGSMIPALAGLIYFSAARGPLVLVRPRWRRGMLWESCLNGCSEMVGQLASAVTTYLFNVTMLTQAGEDGVAAITILIYAQFLLNTLFFGFSMGVAPVIGFLYGQGNRPRLGRVFRISLCFLAAVSLPVFAAARLFGPALIRLFAQPESIVYAMASAGFPVFAVSFLFCGFNIFASAAFTALSDGRTSAVLSFLRTFVLLAGGILLLPRLWGLEGVWLAVPAAEGGSLVVSVLCLAIRFWGDAEG